MASLCWGPMVWKLPGRLFHTSGAVRALACRCTSSALLLWGSHCRLCGPRRGGEAHFWQPFYPLPI
jgi:hypothetical protein